MLILASTSPRRKEILENTGIKFIAVAPNFDEETVSTKNIEVESYVMHLAKSKAFSLKAKYVNDVILASDTIVVLEKEILNKPIDEKDAYQMLRKLSGKKHYVLTAVCILKDDKFDLFYKEAQVEFKSLTDEEIYQYIETKEPMDKAGAYAIQGIGAKFINNFNGDFHTVMGLPIDETIIRLKNFGITK